MSTPIRASDRDLRALTAIVSQDRSDLPDQEGLPPSLLADLQDQIRCDRVAFMDWDISPTSGPARARFPAPGQKRLGRPGPGVLDALPGQLILQLPRPRARPARPSPDRQQGPARPAGREGLLPSLLADLMTQIRSDHVTFSGSEHKPHHLA